MHSQNPYAPPQVIVSTRAVQRSQLGRASLIASLGTISCSSLTLGIASLFFVSKPSLKECLLGALMGAILGVMGSIPAITVTVLMLDRFRVVTSIISSLAVTAVATYVMYILLQIRV